MKKIYYVTVLVLVIAVLTACGSSGNNVEDTLGAVEKNTNNSSVNESDNNGEKDVYTVAMDHSFAPFGFLDEETGEHVGFDVDFVKAIAEEAGIEIEIQPMEFDGVIAGISSGRFDMGVASIFITEERKENIDFSIPYYVSGQVLAVKEGNEEIKSIKDVDGKIVATRTGTASQEYLQKQTEAIPELFPQITEAYQAVLTDRADAAIHDLPNVLYYSKTEAGGKLKVVGNLLTGEEVAVAFPKGSNLVDNINDAIKKIQENGTYDEIYEKWFGERPDEIQYEHSE